MAVVPVVLFHAGVALFSGGYVGVDIFFVISGYLITSTILSELQSGRFSLVSFYERRARRILPALYLVVAISCFPAYLWLLPDELENFGQSVLATVLFSNNVLLTLTSGYWALASEFKPLLHTWSLGVEEHYYLLFPLLMMVGWRLFRRRLAVILTVIALLSLAMAQWGGLGADATFYLLPTRAWELLIGGILAVHLDRNPVLPGLRYAQILSALGAGLIAFSVVMFDETVPSPSLFTLAPTVGTALIILYARDGTAVYALLTRRVVVGIGLISYSAYLWHHPLFAFARAYSVRPPSSVVIAALSALTFALAYLSWRFVEGPFRVKGRFSRRWIFSLSAVTSAVFVSWGYYLHGSHGVPGRMYTATAASGADIYIGYNERAFDFRKDAFAEPSLRKVLVVGDSFGRDFVNMTLESFDVSGVEIVYRDDLSGCVSRSSDAPLSSLIAAADVVVVAKSRPQLECAQGDVEFGRRSGKHVFYVGPKHFGYNLNWLARLDGESRRNRVNPLPSDTARAERELAEAVPSDNYISLLEPIVRDGVVPVTDEDGRLISPDRTHLTRHGAQYLGRRALVPSVYGRLFGSGRAAQAHEPPVPPPAG